MRITRFALLTLFVTTGICSYAQEPAPARAVVNPVDPPDMSQQDRPDLANQITPDQAAQLETSLQSTPDDLVARQKLLWYYEPVGAAGRAQNRFQHIRWLIVNHPESGLTTSVQARPDEENFPEAKQLWLQAADRFGSERRVLLNAADAIEVQGDPETALSLFKRARLLAPDNPGVNRLMAMLLVQGVRNANDTVFAAQARKELEACDSSEARLCGFAGTYLKSERSGDPDLIRLADHLIEVGRAGGYDSVSKRLTGALQPPGTLPGSGFRAASAVPAANLLHREPVVFPSLAVQARIEGVVRFQVVIGKDGAVTTMRLISGHPLLIDAARAALEKYLYKPTLLNGVPVQVVTDVDVPFFLTE